MGRCKACTMGVSAVHGQLCPCSLSAAHWPAMHTCPQHCPQPNCACLPSVLLTGQLYSPALIAAHGLAVPTCPQRCPWPRCAHVPSVLPSGWLCPSALSIAHSSTVPACPQFYPWARLCPVPSVLPPGCALCLCFLRSGGRAFGSVGAAWLMPLVQPRGRPHGDGLTALVPRCLRGPQEPPEQQQNPPGVSPLCLTALHPLSCSVCPPNPPSLGLSSD